MKLSRLFSFPGGSVFGSKKPAPLPPPPAPLPTREDPVVLEAKENERQERLRRAGRAANILTSPQGILAETSGKKTSSELGS